MINRQEAKNAKAELKAVRAIPAIDKARVISYLKATNRHLRPPDPAT